MRREDITKWTFHDTTCSNPLLVNVPVFKSLLLLLPNSVGWATESI